MWGNVGLLLNTIGQAVMPGSTFGLTDHCYERRMNFYPVVGVPTDH